MTRASSNMLTDCEGLGGAAMWYAQELGWPVFPCQRRGKAPLIRQASGGNGCRGATTHAEQVHQWWKDSPEANIGVATGLMHGLFVIDVDGPAGEAALEKFGELPQTPQVRTRKGRHLYFAGAPRALGCSARRLGEQIDTRGNGGYVIAPPSVHPDGSKYAWIAGLNPGGNPGGDTPWVGRGRIDSPDGGQRAPLAKSAECRNTATAAGRAAGMVADNSHRNDGR